MNTHEIIMDELREIIKSIGFEIDDDGHRYGHRIYVYKKSFWTKLHRLLHTSSFEYGIAIIDISHNEIEILVAGYQAYTWDNVRNYKAYTHRCFATFTNIDLSDPNCFDIFADKIKEIKRLMESKTSPVKCFGTEIYRIG